MSEYDAATYERFSGAVRRQVQSLRVILDSLQVNISSQLSQRVCSVLSRVTECSFLSFLSHTHTSTHKICTPSHSCYYSCFSFHPAFALMSWNNYPLSLKETKCYCCFSEWPLSGHPVMWCAKAACGGCLWLFSSTPGDSLYSETEQWLWRIRFLADSLTGEFCSNIDMLIGKFSVRNPILLSVPCLSLFHSLTHSLCHLFNSFVVFSSLK